MNYLDIFLIAIISYLGGMITVSIWQWLFNDCQQKEQVVNNKNNDSMFCIKTLSIKTIPNDIDGHMFAKNISIEHSLRHIMNFDTCKNSYIYIVKKDIPLFLRWLQDVDRDSFIAGINKRLKTNK